jgi:hypothetical protein
VSALAARQSRSILQNVAWQMMRKDPSGAPKASGISMENIRDLRVQRPPIVAQRV